MEPLVHDGQRVMRREMRTMAPGGMQKPPHFEQSPRPRYDDGPHLQEYKQ